MTRIMIYTAMHGRHMVSRTWCEGIKRFMMAAPKGFACEVFVVIDDLETEKLCHEFGFEYGWYSNDYVGKRFNAGLRNICDNYHFDYLMIMGSDDMISDEAWDQYVPCIANGLPYFGFSSIYFFSAERNEVVKFSYEDEGQPNRLIGCGRMIKKSVIREVALRYRIRFVHDFCYGGINQRVGDEVVFSSNIALYLIGSGHAVIISQEFALWNDYQQRGMDSESETRIVYSGIKPHVIYSEKTFMVDIKTNENIWSYGGFRFTNDVEKLEEALSFLGNKERECLRTLTDLEVAKMN